MANLQIIQQQVSGLDTVVSNITNLQQNVTNINNSFPGGTPPDPTQPGQADQQIATKQFVNSSIVQMAADYVQAAQTMQTPFQTHQALVQGPWFINGTAAGSASSPSTTNPPQNNDYQFVTQDEDHKDAANVAQTTRYRYDGATSAWQFQLVVNNSAFTAAQLNQMNSGITSTIVSNISTNFSSAQQIAAAQSGITAALVTNIPTTASQLQAKDSGVTQQMVNSWTNDANIIQFYAPTQTTFVVVLDKSKTGVVQSSFECWNIVTGQQIAPTVSGSGTTYTLTVPNSQVIGVRFINP